MPLSDEQKKSVLEVIKYYFGNDASAFIEEVAKDGADQGANSNDIYNVLIQGTKFPENFKASVDEKDYPAAKEALIQALLKYQADTEASDDKK
ncbi:hypothetical protein V491_01594 [Pseudogymnoascus sp. VKM F-3775]|nr:hypothetical protein V491_01594 [Pseudogymnoascus sp. VKM F-3775]